MADDHFPGVRTAFVDLGRALRHWAATLMVGSLLIAPAAFATDRFEIVDGDLLDQSTGLLWQPTSATTLSAMPANSSLANGWRIASTNDVLNLFSDDSFASETTVSQTSDGFKVLSFFASPPSTSSSCGFLPSGSTCISGIAADTPGTGQAGYDIVVYGYRIGKTGSVTVDSTATLGGYTQDRCGGLCGQQTYFTVASVPEPAGWTLTTLGIAAMLFCIGIRSRIR